MKPIMNIFKVKVNDGIIQHHIKSKMFKIRFMYRAGIISILWITKQNIIEIFWWTRFQSLKEKKCKPKSQKKAGNINEVIQIIYQFRFIIRQMNFFCWLLLLVFLLLFYMNAQWFLWCSNNSVLKQITWLWLLII